MKSEIQEHFSGNLERVEGLVKFYRDSADGTGRRRVAETDVLRSAVVFLHATLEDVLRSALEWKWPQANPDYFDRIAFAGGTAEKINLPQLAKHRGKTVQDLVDEAIQEELAQSNFNNLGEIKKALGRIGLAEEVLDPYRLNLQAMMKRRHLIVHRADRNEMQGRGHHVARTLAAATVEIWRDAVRDFGTAVLAEL